MADECTCGSERPASARYGHNHLKWCDKWQPKLDSPSPVRASAQAQAVKVAADVIAIVRDEKLSDEQWMAQFAGPIAAALAAAEARGRQQAEQELATERKLRAADAAAYLNRVQQAEQERDAVWNEGYLMAHQKYAADLLTSCAQVAALTQALKDAKAFRLRNLAATCPDCEDGCDHGASRDKLIGIIDAALTGAQA